MNTQQTSTLVKLFLQYLSTRDLENIVSLFADTIDWNIPGDKSKAPWLGPRKTIGEVREFFQLLWPNTQPISASVDKLLVDGNCAVILGNFSTKMLATGKVVHSFFCIQMIVENEKITQYYLYEDTLAVSDAMTD